jgi:hypothetical protein
LRAEAALKKLSRAEKLALVAGAFDLPRPARKSAGRGEKNSSAGHRPSKAKRG